MRRNFLIAEKALQRKIKALRIEKILCTASMRSLKNPYDKYTEVLLCNLRFTVLFLMPSSFSAF